MMQQVNLYPYIPALKKDWLCASYVLKAWVGLILILIFYSAYPVMNIYFINKKLGIAKMQEVEAAQRFQTIAVRYPNTSHEPLQKQIASLVQNISSKSKLLTNISIDPENKHFSKYLYLLSRIMPQDMWLTEIHVIPDTKIFMIKGYSLSSTSPAHLLADLKNEKLMNLYEIKLEKLINDSKNKHKQVWMFTINTTDVKEQAVGNGVDDK